jgi:hypothetical protein
MLVGLKFNSVFSITGKSATYSARQEEASRRSLDLTFVSEGIGRLRFCIFFYTSLKSVETRCNRQRVTIASVLLESDGDEWKEV